MKPVIQDNSYGKSRVRVTKVTRKTDGHHELKIMNVDVQLRGDFAASYSHGDNTKVIATDSQKNTVYALAADHPVNDIETFAIFVGTHFVDKYPQVQQATISIQQELYDRISHKGKPLAHPYAFTQRGMEQRVAVADVIRGKGIQLVSGIRGLSVFRSAKSEWTNFVSDEFRTLPDATDRILATVVDLRWTYSNLSVDFNTVYDKVRAGFLDHFANTYSLGVQHTQYLIATKLLEQNAELKRIQMTLPNKHHIPFDLRPLGGRVNRNEIFITSDEPHGLITLDVGRQSASSHL